MRQFVEILLDGVSILPVVKALRLDRRSDQAVDALSLELADYSLYSEFDFGTLPETPRVHVATAAGDPKTDGATSGNALNSASSSFLTAGVTEHDLLLVLESDEPADIGAWPITNIAATQLQSSHNFGTETGVVFIVLTCQGRFFIEKPDVAEDKNSLTIPSLWGRSALARLIDPFAPKLSRTWKVATSLYEVCRELVREAGMDEDAIVFDIDDYEIPQDVLSVTGQYPLQIISDLAGKTNGYVRNTKGGNLWIKGERFHFGALPIAQALDDDDVQETRTRIEYPEFGNRILIRSSVASATQPIRVRIIAPESCLRGDGRAQMVVEAVVVDNEGKPVADGTPVAFTIDNSALAFFLPPTSGTGEKVIISEPQRSSGLFSLSTDYPIGRIVGVFLEEDFQKNVNLFDGGSFDGSGIELTQELPFSDTRLVVDYIAKGIAISTLRTVANAPEQETEIHAAVGKMRDSTKFCINNKRNISVRMSADITEHNLCLPGQRVSKIIAQVTIDGAPGSGAMVQWLVAGPGAIAPTFSAVATALIQGEIGRALSTFEVATKHDITEVLGVWLLASNKTGTNFFKVKQKRPPTFSGNKITLGTDLPSDDAQVIIDYRAQGVASTVFTGREEVGKATITARLSDGTSAKVEETIEIEMLHRCTDPIEGNTPKDPPGGEKDCSKSVPSAVACNASNYPNPINATVEECICRQESFGSPCPDDKAGCENLCDELYDKYGLDPLSCDKRVTEDERRKLEVQLGVSIMPAKAPAYRDCASECAENQTKECFDPCLAKHKQATIDRCAKTCEDHGLIIEPRTGSIECSGGKSIAFTVKGGKPPYNWNASVGVLTVNDEGTEATLKPPPNPGGGSFGNAVAYQKTATQLFGAGCVTERLPGARFGCEDQQVLACPNTDLCPSPIGPTVCRDSSCPDDSLPICNSPEWCAQTSASCDVRSPEMISGGCNPCGTAFAEPKMISVSDSGGLSATAVVTV